MAAFSHTQLQLKLMLQQQLQQEQQQQQQQHQPPEPFRNFAPVDGQIPVPISFFNTSNYADPPNPSYHAMGLAPLADGGAGSSVWEPLAPRIKEQDFLENSQVTSAEFLQAGSVSTGLGLSLDDGRAAAVAASTGDSPLTLFGNFDSDAARELQRIDAEMDRFVRIQGERLRQSILENVQSKQLKTLASLEGKILRKLQEKDSEVEAINKKNMELEELSRQLSIEVGTWQQRAKYNENMITALKYNIEQVYAQGKENKEGFGDSEVDDTASYCNGGGIDFQLLRKENKDMKESMTCKVCRVNEACMLLLPCQHLCLCKECESKLGSCPLCQVSKFIGMEIYM